jgi:hypothetical protein
VNDKSSLATSRLGGKASVPVEEAVGRYFIPEKVKTFRQVSWGFSIDRTIEQFYGQWPGKPGPVLDHS